MDNYLSSFLLISVLIRNLQLASSSDLFNDANERHVKIQKYTSLYRNMQSRFDVCVCAKYSKCIKDLKHLRICHTKYSCDPRELPSQWRGGKIFFFFQRSQSFSSVLLS